MTSRLARARSFLLGASRSTALRVAPLALLALGALQAATVTVDGPTFQIGGGSITSTVINTPNGPGVKFFGSASSDFSLPTSTHILEFDFLVQNSGGPTTQLDFVLTPFFQDNLDYQVTDGAETVYDFGSFGPIVIGEFDMFAFNVVAISPLINGSTPVTNGTVRFSFSSQNAFSIDIPNDSIDFTPTASAVPEPGTMALALGGAAVLAVVRRRRQ